MNIILNKAEHTCGDKRCCECWKGYPAKCMCGGLVHAQFVKESWQNVIDLVYACDICGDNFKFPGQKARKNYKFTKRNKFNRFNKPKYVNAVYLYGNF